MLWTTPSSSPGFLPCLLAHCSWLSSTIWLPLLGLSTRCSGVRFWIQSAPLVSLLSLPHLCLHLWPAVS